MPEPPAINRHGQFPVYYLAKDEIAAPGIHTFESAEEFYAALFHELAHSTGHSRRLTEKKSLSQTVLAASLTLVKSSQLK